MIQRTADGQAAALENVSFDYAQDAGVDHRRFHIPMTQKLLDCSDIVAIREQVGGEAVAERVRGDVFVDLGLTGGVADGSLDGAGVDVVTARAAGQVR